MYDKLRALFALLAVGCFVWILVLLFKGFDRHYENVRGDQSVTVRCTSVFSAGSGSLLRDSGGGVVHLRVTEGKAAIDAAQDAASEHGIRDPFYMTGNLEAECGRMNSTHVAYIALLAIPTSVLTVLALRRRPTQT